MFLNITRAVKNSIRRKAPDTSINKYSTIITRGNDKNLAKSDYSIQNVVYNKSKTKNKNYDDAAGIFTV